MDPASKESGEIAIWVPFLSALGGGIVAGAGSWLAAWQAGRHALQQKKTELDAVSQERDEERLRGEKATAASVVSQLYSVLMETRAFAKAQQPTEQRLAEVKERWKNAREPLLAFSLGQPEDALHELMMKTSLNMDNLILTLERSLEDETLRGDATDREALAVIEGLAALTLAVREAVTTTRAPAD